MARKSSSISWIWTLIERTSGGTGGEDFGVTKRSMKRVGYGSLRPSSSDLHPTSGGRFVFERQADADHRYDVGVYLPGGVELHGVLSVAGEEEGVQVDTEDRWVLDQIEKLSRVLRRTNQRRVVRWRPRD